MKHLPFKLGSLGIALSVLLLFSTGFADDFADFEKLLQEAIRASQNEAAPAKPVKPAEPAPNPGTAARNVTAPKPVAPKVAAAPKPAADVISDGWTTVKPNAPGVVVPEPRIVPPPAVRTPVQTPQADPFAVSDEPEEQEEIELPEPLFEPDPIDNEKPAIMGPMPLFHDSIFEEEYTIITDAKADEINILEPEAINIETQEEEGTISEPKRVGEPKTTTSAAPDEQDALSAMLNDLENETIDEDAENTSNVPGNVAAEDAAAPENTQVTAGIPAFDGEDDETTWKMINAALVGDPHAPDKLKLMYDEILNGMRTRNITGRYDMWKGFSKGILRDTAGINTHSELDGRSRLTWYQKLYAEPIRSTFEAEEYSRELFVGLSGGHRHLAELMPGIRERMDVSKREDAGIKFPLCTTPMEAVVEVKRCLLLAASSHARAFSPLTSAELSDLEKNFVETFVGKGCINGHTIPARSVGRKHVDIMDRVDKAALYDGAEALIPLTNTALLDLLAQLPDDALPQVMIGGQRVQRLTTSAGDIIIGGHGKNVYDLDSSEMRDVICVISRGEDDTFREGSCNMNRPVFVVMAMGKKNTFVGTKPGIQGGSVMGISMLLDRSESSSYSAVDVAQGSTMGGVGILINYSGTNTYKAMRRVQGHALLGLGMLIDRGTGNASYKASLWAQGFGAPGGFGILSNSGGGNNHYYCGGLYLDSYPEHPGYDGWGQGVGAGIRQVANGGIGVILSGTGNDVYEVDYFGHGGGYWLGVGIARDFGGDDIRHGTTLATYNGIERRPGNRAEAQWTRFANGFGCHYALGYCFDDGGNDTYGGRIMGTGMAWDLAYGILCDFNGSGKYTAIGNMTQGVGAEGSIGILFSYGGDDTFASRSQGLASGGVTYHPPACGGNFSFLINYGGNNKFGAGASNNSYVQRGTPSGFLIQRPTEKEASGNIVAMRQAVEKRNQEIAEFDAMIVRLKEEAAEQKRRYIPPRQQRPKPIPESQIIAAVPDFDSNVRKADAVETNVK